MRSCVMRLWQHGHAFLQVFAIVVQVHDMLSLHSTFSKKAAAGICLLIIVSLNFSNVITFNDETNATITKKDHEDKSGNETIFVPNDTNDNETIVRNDTIPHEYDDDGDSLALVLFKSENPYNLDLSIPEKMPLITIDPKDFTSQSLGKATIDMFRGEWVEIKEGEPYYSYEQTICPKKNESMWRYSLCRDENPLRDAKRYVADSLRPFNATQFIHFLQDNGPIYFVGDSLSGQHYRSLECMLEAGGYLTQNGISRGLVNLIPKRIVVPTQERQQAIEVRVDKRYDIDPEKTLAELFDSELAWVDQVIKSNASSVVFNFGTWYSARILHVRSDWCNHTSWKYLGRPDIVVIYEETLRLMLLPKLKKLVANGVIPIWRDTSPGGLWNPTIGDIEEAKYSLSWKLHPVYNRIGRRITQEARGLVLPIFDMSMARSEDHIEAERFGGLGTDLVHWCIHYSPNAVPHMWVQLLHNVLFDENGESHALSPGKLEVEEESAGSSSSDEEVADDIYGKFDMRFSYSKSRTSPCKCSGTSNYFQCVANIKCKWSKTKSCVEKSSRDGQEGLW